MRPRELCSRINDFLVDGLAVGAFDAIQSHILEGPPASLRLTPVVAPGMISPGGVSVPEFISLLEDNAYSAVFHDGALIVLQCIFKGDDLYSHRYTYIPCPVSRAILSQRREEDGLAEWLRDAVEVDPTIFRSLGTYRFDCVRVAVADGAGPHPVSHFTFGSPECRLPVRAPMSPAGFFDFLIENFYRSLRRLWRPYAPHLQCYGAQDTITSEERRLYHFNREPAC